MNAIIPTLAIFWLLMIISFILMKRGLSIFNDVAKGMGMFMLEKALGPAIDFVQGKPGSASRTWIMHGMIWTMVASILTFEGLWLSHDPTALHSLGAWGYSPDSQELLYAGRFAGVFGAAAMMIIGAGLHVIPALSGTNLASESNATLVSGLWTLSVLILVIGAHSKEILGVDVMVIGTALQSLALLAIIMNQLLTISNATRPIAVPGWLIIFGLIGDPIAVLSVILSGAYETGVGQWLVYHMIGGTFLFCGIAGVSLYASSMASGNPLWSRTLVGFTLFGALIAINPLGSTDTTMAADMLGLQASEISSSTQDHISGSFLMALAAIPIIAYSSNLLVTLRGKDAFVENADSPGIAEMNMGALLLVPIAIGALFVQTDALGGVGELSAISETLDLLGLWAVLIPLSLGTSLYVLPQVSGRKVLSVSRSRAAFWLMSGGAIAGLTFTIMADLNDMALVEALAENPSSITEELRILGSVTFYGTVLGSIFHCTNVISGQFRGEKLAEEVESSTTLSPHTYELASSTSVRRILASGATLDTEVTPVSQSEESGSATEL
ncbi:MAG: hypothetical protein CMG70_05115 [Candidatus Marinimicrobia bacterium]|nr:hypothetical protein [Euryarchaeota archaeon]MBH51331.1 hypothetical protein [Candidatus Neomarinimicrobiota bacterium]|tara:strand:+ start:3307 stop:4971 length:1665 start_codon:yes stop_codon:yes gene_type:complete